jgi:glycosyltransferase involved in cell wall biosynthesis
MKILFVSPAIRMGGVDTAILRIGQFLMARQHEVSYLETLFKGEWSNWFATKGFNVVTKKLAYHTSSKHHAMSLLNTLKTYDVIILNDDMYARSVAGMLPDHKHLISIIHTDLHGQYLSAIGNNNDYDFVVAVSEAILDKALEVWNVPLEKLTFIPYGVEVSSTPPPQRFATNADALKLIFLGRLVDWHKGIFLLPAIMSHSLLKNENISLTIVGDGSDRTQLEEMFKAVSTYNNVNFAGSKYKEEVQQILLEHDVLLMPSNFEGLPIALLEAMAAGVIPIATNIPGSTASVIDEGVDGYLVQKSDVNTFASYIKHLVAHPEKRYEMSKNAWLKICNKYSNSIMGNAYLQLIHRLMQVKRVEARSGQIDLSLLGDLPSIPSIFVRPVRKMLKIIGVWKK